MTFSYIYSFFCFTAGVNKDIYKWLILQTKQKLPRVKPASFLWPTEPLICLILLGLKFQNYHRYFWIKWNSLGIIDCRTTNVSSFSVPLLLCTGWGFVKTCFGNVIPEGGEWAESFVDDAAPYTGKVDVTAFTRLVIPIFLVRAGTDTIVWAAAWFWDLKTSTGFIGTSLLVVVPEKFGGTGPVVVQVTPGAWGVNSAPFAGLVVPICQTIARCYANFFLLCDWLFGSSVKTSAGLEIASFRVVVPHRSMRAWPVVDDGSSDTGSVDVTRYARLVVPVG